MPKIFIILFLTLIINGCVGNAKVRLKLFEDAITDFTRAIEKDSAFKSAYNNRGMAKSYMQQYEEAIKDFNYALYLTPNDIYALNNMANSYHGLGDRENACKYWQLAISNGYKYQAEWKEMYNIDDPVELFNKYCQ